MGLEIATVGIIVAAVGAAAGAYGTYQAARAQKKQARAQKEAQEVSTAQQKNEQAEQRRQQIRQQRIRTAQIEQSSQNAGAAGSSGEVGAISGVQSVVAGNLAFGQSSALAAQGISAQTQRAANYGMQSQIYSGIGNLGFSALNLGMNMGAGDALFGESKTNSVSTQLDNTMQANPSIF